MNVKDNPGDYIKRTGPTNDEAKVIERMVKDEDATESDLYRAYPDIERVALRRWIVSLKEGPAAALKVEANELETARDAKEAAEAARKLADKTVASAEAEAKRIIDAAKAEAAKLVSDAKKKNDPLA